MSRTLRHHFFSTANANGDSTSPGVDANAQGEGQHKCRAAMVHLMVPTLSERLHAQGLLLVLVQLVLVLVRRARASTNVEQLALQHGNTN